jgi:hypothetical protein
MMHGQTQIKFTRMIVGGKEAFYTTPSSVDME